MVAIGHHGVMCELACVKLNAREKLTSRKGKQGEGLARDGRIDHHCDGGHHQNALVFTQLYSTTRHKYSTDYTGYTKYINMIGL
jgi:hypothetical protein